MKHIKLLLVLLLFTVQQSYAQQTNDNKKEISLVIKKYSKSVIEKDSAVFYSLFNDGEVTWCAAYKDRSQVKLQGTKIPVSNYFSGSYKGFLRGLFRYKTTEDKFDNIRITEDGTVASVTMDYSFWADNKMTNWGGKYLTLIKRNGEWKITSVIFSLELTSFFKQPTLKERKRT
jgi:hypothetical protein